MEKRISMHPHKPHATSQPSQFKHTHTHTHTAAVDIGSRRGLQLRLHLHIQLQAPATQAQAWQRSSFATLVHGCYTSCYTFSTRQEVITSQSSMPVETISSFN